MILGPDGYLEVHPSQADRLVFLMMPPTDDLVVWSANHEIPPPVEPDEYERRRYRIRNGTVRSIWLARDPVLRRDNRDRQWLREWFLSLMRIGWNPADTEAIVQQLRRRETVEIAHRLLSRYARQIEDDESQ